MTHGFRYLVALETDKALDGQKFHDMMKQIIEDALAAKLLELNIKEQPKVREGHYEKL